MNDTLTTATETEIVLAGMFTENTGRALCDSGDAYGRNWERNQGRVAADFLNTPSGSFTEYGGASLSTFHFLNSRLEFNAELQAEFDAFAAENPDDGWLQLMEMFVAEHPDWVSLTVNTYNHESALDQTIQFVQVDTEGGDACYGDLVLLQVHGGCDVRGGYTAPKLFTTVGDNEVGLLDDSDIDIWCEGSVIVAPQTETLPTFDDTPPVTVTHQWHSDDAGYHWYGNDYAGDGTPDYSTSYGSTDPELAFDDDGHALCPCCTTPTRLVVADRYGY
jgi:hypothetical protein